MKLRDELNMRDNETKILIANIQAQAKEYEQQQQQDQASSEEDKANLLEKMREFDARLKLDRDRLNLDKYKAEADISIKKQNLNKKTK